MKHDCADTHNITFLLEEYKIVWGEANRQNDQTTMVQRFSAIAIAVGIPMAIFQGKDSIIFAIIPILMALALIFLIWKELVWNVCLVKLMSIEKTLRTMDGPYLPINWATVTTLMYQSGEAPDTYDHYHLPLVHGTIRGFYYFINLLFLTIAVISGYVWFSSLSTNWERTLWAVGYAAILIYLGYVIKRYLKYVAKVRSYLREGNAEKLHKTA